MLESPGCQGRLLGRKRRPAMVRQPIRTVFPTPSAGGSPVWTHAGHRFRDDSVRFGACGCDLGSASADDGGWVGAFTNLDRTCRPTMPATAPMVVQRPTMDLSRARRTIPPTSATIAARKAIHWQWLRSLMSASRLANSRVWCRAGRFSTFVTIRSAAPGTMASRLPRVAGRGSDPKTTSSQCSIWRCSATCSGVRSGVVAVPSPKERSAT